MSTAMNLGAWRDRTNLFISYRQSYAHHPQTKLPRNNGFHYNADSERAGLMGDVDGDTVIEMDLLPPRWLDVQDDITQQLSTIAGQMKKLDQLHAKHVLPGFDDENEKAKEEREIESITQEITRGFSSCQRAIKRIDVLVREQQQQQGGNLSSADGTLAKNLQISLAARVGEASTTFRKKQAAYLKKLRSLGGMASISPGTNTPVSSSFQYSNPATDAALLDSENDRNAAQSTLLQTASLKQKPRTTHDAAIAQREREIERIAQGVLDLSQIFQDINAMVIDQGTILDRIDYNVERTHEHVKEAEKELKVATGYQKKSTKRKIILLLVLLVVGMFILVLVKPRRSSGGSTSPAPVPPSEGGGLPPQPRIARRAGTVEQARRPLEWKRRRRRRGGELLAFVE